MRLPAALFALVLCAGIAACGGGDEDASATPRLRASTAPVPSTPVATATSAAPALEIEVSGIVGVVNMAANSIEVRAVQGGSFSHILVGPMTRIRRAGGGSLGLNEIRPSDRIVARGRPGEAPDTLTATQVTVQSIDPGGGPGAGG